MSGQQTALISARQIDELLRNALRIGDPRNPSQVATALRARYALEANKLDQESVGLPQAPTRLLPARAGAGGPGTVFAGDQALDWVLQCTQADLEALMQAPANREWQPELQAWRQTLLRELEEGAAAARQSPDSGKRDRTAFAIRHMVDYAWLARLVAVLHPEMASAYRRLATTLDRAADVLRVLLGVGLFEAGFADGGLLVHVSQAELMFRRDTVLKALRSFESLEENDEDSKDWGDGPASYRALEQAIDNAGAPELKVYLREEMLGPVLEHLISDAFSRGGTAGAPFPASSPSTFERLQLNRFLEITEQQLENSNGFEHFARSVQKGGSTRALPSRQPVSAGLHALVHSLKLFLAPFEGDRAGARYMDLAMPLPIATWQMDEDDAEARMILRDLVNARAALAYALSAEARCTTDDPAELQWQALVDRALFSIDRCVDLLALGVGRPGAWQDSELRAISHARIALVLVGAIDIPEGRGEEEKKNYDLLSTAVLNIPSGVSRRLVEVRQVIEKLKGPGTSLNKLDTEVRPRVGKEEQAFFDGLLPVARRLAPRGDLSVLTPLAMLLAAAGYDRAPGARGAFIPPRRVSQNDTVWLASSSLQASRQGKSTDGRTDGKTDETKVSQEAPTQSKADDSQGEGETKP
jgi:hypothetical protein